MKNMQVIDGADNCEYAVFAVTDEEFAQIFPGEHQNVEFIEDMIKRLGKKQCSGLLRDVWSRRIEKPSVIGIHGTLFYELLFKKKYYPTKNDRQMVT